jgi:putative transposase
MAQKKIKDFGIDERMKLINKTDKKYSIRSQCKLLGINRSRFYYDPVPISEETLILMGLLDEEYTKHPFYGVGKMRKYLRGAGYCTGTYRTRTLLRTMGLMAVYPQIYPGLILSIRSTRIYCAASR